MNGLLLRGLASDLGLALLHSLWQVALLAAALWSLLTLLHRASPRLRHALAMAALLAAAAWPAATFAQLRRERAAVLTELAERPLALRSAPAPAGAKPLAARIEAAGRPALPWIAALWMAGAAAFLLRFAGGWWWLARLRRRAARAPRELRELAEGLARRMGLRAPELRIAEVAGPFSFGLFRTVVVLPAACLAQLDARALEALLAHEFAHLRRLDFLLNAVQSMAEALLFHHPLAWWISAAARLERERCCDQAAVGVCGDARYFAALLNQLDDLRPPAAALAAQGAPLMTRIRHLLGAAARPSRPALFGASLSLFCLGLAAAVPLAREAAAAPAILVPAPLLRQVDAAAEANHIEPALLRAMVQCESGFNPRVPHSSAGSIGLLQVMPATAQRFGFSAQDLEDPAKNLQAGTAYLRFLLDRYQGNTQKAVLAYNAGEKALDANGGLPPAEETRLYGEAVMALYRGRAIQATDAAEGEELVQGRLERDAEGLWHLSFSGYFLGGCTAQISAPGASPIQLQNPRSLEPDTALRISFSPARGPLSLSVTDQANRRHGSAELPLAAQDFTLRLKR